NSTTNQSKTDTTLQASTSNLSVKSTTKEKKNSTTMPTTSERPASKPTTTPQAASVTPPTIPTTTSRNYSIGECGVTVGGKRFGLMNGEA
ncbi:hypothetical protein PFISCL1PPCAC_29012, partial [Pristionchus fissidentatus]